MTNNQVLKIYEGLSSLREDSSVALPAKVAFAIVRNLRKLEPIVEDYSTAKNLIIVNNGVPDEENPNIYRVVADKLEYVTNELNSLAETENRDIELSLVEISDLEGLNLSVPQMEALYEMISGEG